MAWYTFTNVFTGEQVWREDQPGTPIEDPESARFLIALTGLALSPWLYPLLTVAAGAAAFVAGEIVDAKGLTPPASYAMTLGAVLPVFVAGMRVEQRLGSFAPYRWLRHLMRLAVPGGIIYLVATGGGPASSRDLVGGITFVVVIAQVVLSFASGMRDDWHVALRALRLRARTLAD